MNTNLFENIESPTYLATVNDSGMTATVLNLKVKRGKEEVEVRVSNPALVAVSVDAYKMLEAGKITAKALCIILAKVNLDDVKKAGFKSFAEYATAVLTDLDANTVNTYRRVGLLFGDLKSEGYYWKEMVGQSVSATNLCTVAKHYFRNAEGKSIDLEACTEEERTRLYVDFMTAYVNNGKLTLTDTLAGLRKQIEALEKKPDIVTTAQELPAEGQPAEGQPAEGQPAEGQPAEGQPAEGQPAEQSESKYESALHCIRSLEVLLGTSDKKVATALQTLIKAVENLK